MARVLRSGEPIHAVEAMVERPDGSRIWTMMHIDPIKAADGTVVGAINCFHDSTATHQAQERLKASERWYRDLLQALPAAVYTTDAEGRITFYNQAAVALSGREPELGSDRWCVTWRLFHPDGAPLPHDQCPMALALREGRPYFGAEAVAERPDGSRVPFAPYPSPLRDAEGRLIGAVNMLVDISERKQAEAQQKVLIDELNHRVKNTLATVQSLAAQTIRGSAIPQDLRQGFEARLIALSRAHDQLSNANWDSADLQQVAHDVLEPYRRDAIRLRGAPIRLPPHAALTMAMVLHELATNAAKYGALSASGGEVDLAWTTTGANGERRLRIDWRESGGPAVREPKRRGFGSRLVEIGIAHELRGTAKITFATTGVTCVIDIPLQRHEH